MGWGEINAYDNDFIFYYTFIFVRMYYYTKISDDFRFCNS